MPQMEAVECGAACLTMVLRGFGHHAELSDIREACGVSRDGVNAKQLVRVAREYKLTPRARKLEPSELASVTDPAILHWEMNHFVVLVRWTPREADILDPAIGPRRVEAADFNRCFTGVCIELSPGEGFEKKPRRALSFKRYAGMLQHARPTLGAIIAVSFVLSALGFAVPLSTKLIVDRVLRSGQTSWLEVIGVVSVGLVVLLFLSQWLRTWLVSRVRDHVDATMSAEILGHMLSLPVRFFEQRHAADLVARIDSVRIIRELLAERAVSLLVDGPLLLTYLAVLFAYSPRLGLVLVGSALAYWLVYSWARPRQQASFRERSVKEVRAAVQLLQTLRGITTLKAAGRELGAHEKWHRLFVHALNATTLETGTRVLADASLVAIRLGSSAIVLVWGGFLVMNGHLSVGELLACLLLAGAFLVPLENATLSLLRMGELPVHVARMDDVFQTAREPSGARPCPPLAGDIRFENVTFRYGPTAPPTLDDVSLSIGRGEKVALVGPSGSGKSTVAKLLLGLHAAESGKIFFDDHELSEIDVDSVRRQIGTVLQETALFEGTIRENIALYHPTAPLDDIVSAARVAQLHDDVEALPHGYDTLITSQGGPLSGGQRQRLALARAVLHRPPILVLDEATSALDTVTEAAVDAYLSSRLCTRVVIAHRLSTIRDADRILVIADGKVAEQGRHDELVAAGGFYAKLVSKGDNAPARPSTPAPASTDVVRAEDLGRFEVLADLSDAERAALARVLTRRALPEGTALVHRGDRGPGLYFVQSGELEVVLEEPGLARHRVGTVGAGAVLGEISLLDGSPVSATLISTARTEVLHLPVWEIERLRAEGDVLAVRLTLALGRLVAGRLRAKTDERARLKRAESPEPREAASSQPGERRGRALRVEETALGASLTPGELERLHELGEVQTFAAGARVVQKGDPGDRCHLVLGGLVAVTLDDVPGRLNTVKAGELLGEVGLFDPGPRTATCTAAETVTTFSIDHAELRTLLLSGDAMAAKILRHLAHSLARTFRVSDLRLREAIALENGEKERADRAREEARVLAASRDLTLTTEDDEGRVPVIRSDAPLSAAACLTAVLRSMGRPVSFTAVAEACSDGARVSESSLTRGARTFGLLVRRLTLEPQDLRRIDAPLVLALEDGAHAVARGWRAGRLEIVSPIDGETSLSFEELSRRFSGAAYEVRVDDAGDGALVARVVRALRPRRSTISQIVGIAVAVQLLGLAIPMALSLVVGRAIPSGDLGILRAAALVLATLIATQVLLSWHRGRAILYLRTHLDASLLDQLFRHVLSLRIDFFERSPAGAVLSRFEAFRIVRDLIGNQGIAAAIDVPVLVLSLVAMVFFDAHLALLPLAATALVAVSFTTLAPRLRRLAVDELAATGAQRTRLIEVLSGVVTLRVVGARELGLRHWLPSALRAVRMGAGQEAIQGAWFALADFARLATVALATWWGAARVLRGELSLGTLVGFTAVASAYLMALREIGSHVVAYSRAARRIALVRSTFDEPPEQIAAKRMQPGRLRGRIRLERVTFGYGEGKADVLKDVSVDIEPGTKVALVGSSGSGKSTLGKLLLGFYLPRSGRVLFDGRDIAGLDLGSVRSQLGVVLQEGQLFAGSVRDNLAMNAPDAPIERIIDAARLADIHEVIADLPMGYDTIVADGGAGFSGGQRQRLTIARALVHEPAVLLLDEATSALDNLSQGRIEESLSRLTCTRIVVAHRLSTVVDADQIIVLERGRVVETGTHAALMAKKGHYYKLAQAQLA